MIVFGPIPSRRLGRSLGINNIPPFIMDYDEGSNFSFTSEAKKELLDILSIHPMREKAVKEFLTRANLPWDIIPTLISEDILRIEEYSGDIFFVKNN